MGGVEPARGRSRRSATASTHAEWHRQWADSAWSATPSGTDDATSAGQGATADHARPGRWGPSRRAARTRLLQRARSPGGGGDGLLRPPHHLPRGDRAARPDQPDDHLVPLVPVAGVRVGLRAVLALDGRLRIARPEGALLRSRGGARAAAREGRHADREAGEPRRAVVDDRARDPQPHRGREEPGAADGRGPAVGRERRVRQGGARRARSRRAPDRAPPQVRQGGGLRDGAGQPRQPSSTRRSRSCAASSTPRGSPPVRNYITGPTDRRRRARS